MADPNPYEPPQSGDPVLIRGTGATSDSLLVVWERRRIWFNVVLLVITLLVGVLPPPLLSRGDFWQFAAQGAVVANLCFCSGAVVEWYLSHVGIRGPAVGWFLFLAGTGLSALLTLLAIFANFVPWQA